MSTKVKAQAKEVANQSVATTEAPAALMLTEQKPTRAYLIDKVDEASGEVTQVSRFRYLPGHPRQVRFDAKAGQFSIGGTVPLGNSLSFIPLAWRIFQDDILNMGRKLWAELFYADEKGAVCAVLFHGYSVENLYRLIEPLFYDDLTLADVVVKVTAEKKQTTKEGKTATYYIAQFSYEPAPAEEVAARRDYARDLPIWRTETYTEAADIRIQHGYTVPEDGDPHTSAQPAELPQAA
jgi:hypothetical protein